jgi:hypothetical protein
MRLAIGVVGHWEQRVCGGPNPGRGGFQFYPVDQEPSLRQA